MSMADVFAPILALRREVVLRETWGHMAPTPRVRYRGHIVFAISEYSGGAHGVVAMNFENLDDSPWLFEHVCDFITRCRPPGVYRWDGEYVPWKNKQGAWFPGRVRKVKA